MTAPLNKKGIPKGYMEYVCGFMFDSMNRVLLILKQKPEWQKGKLNGIGGKIEPGEAPIDAMVREFWEETQIHTERSEWDLKVRLSGPDYVVHFYSAMREWTEVRPMVCTIEMPTFVKLNKLPINTIYNLRWMLPLFRDK